ncbi:phage tail protein [Paenibacillus xylanexedens]|uniref:phage tail protein n=1 Tax=Paenibacillus xylanexedens TaxID=528191 RepID=UPI0028EA0918|nr:phage tail protein [Paenibacillus xylanexedens]
MLETMYPAAVNSRQTELAQAIDDTQTSFTVLDGSVLPLAPNLLTLGTDESAETVLYTGLSENEVTGVTRGFESTAKTWAAGVKLARYFTAYDHDTFRENIADLDERLNNIPAPQDASLTDKGIVQLSNEVDGDSEEMAATEKAVNDARVVAISAAGQAADDKYIRKDRPSNQLPNSSGELGLMGWTNLNSASLFTASRGADSLGPCTFVSTQANSIMQSEVFFFQGEDIEYTLSADFLNPVLTSNQMVVSLKTTSGSLVASIVNDGVAGWHRRAVTFTRPVGVIGVYVEVVVVSGVATAQRRVRRIMLSIGVDGDVWNQDANDSLLFQSVSSGKKAVAAAITGKGVEASGSDTFPELATKVGQIQQGAYQSTLVNMQTEQTRVLKAGEIGGMNWVADVPANTKVLSMTQGASNTVINNIRGPIANVIACYALLDFEGRMWRISGGSAGGSDYVYTLSSIVDLVTKTCLLFRATVVNSSSITMQSAALAWQAETTAMPTGFRTDRPMQIVMAVVSNNWQAQTTVYYRPGYLNIKTG